MCSYITQQVTGFYVIIKHNFQPTGSPGFAISLDKSVIVIFIAYYKISAGNDQSAPSPPRGRTLRFTINIHPTWTTSSLAGPKTNFTSNTELRIPDAFASSRYTAATTRDAAATYCFPRGPT